MRKSDDTRPPTDRVVILILLALLLFASPFFDWMQQNHPVWYMPFALWALLIAAIYATNRARNR